MGKKAVLVGCNYPATKAELKGCINDVTRMYRCLVDRYGFGEEDITVLIDTEESYTQPTGGNIRRAIANLIDSAEPGDHLFIHYSGHGTRLPAETGEDDDTGYDECIVPCDMNLITDDDFREFVDKTPRDCRITIVSDSCHSGGLIDRTKEQIGESTRRDDDGGGDSGFSFKGFIKQSLQGALESRGIHVPLGGGHGGGDDDLGNQGECGVKNRSLPLSTLIEILKDKTGREDIDVGKLRPTLVDVFGEDASPKLKKFMVFIMGKLQGAEGGGGGGGLAGMVGGLALQFVKQKLDDNDEGYGKQQVFAGANRAGLPDNGILISGCQSDQTSADANPSGRPSDAYGALSNAVQTILVEADGDISNRELVLKARHLLRKQGFAQRPGLYCSDNHVHAPFIA